MKQLQAGTKVKIVIPDDEIREIEYLFISDLNNKILTVIEHKPKVKLWSNDLLKDSGMITFEEDLGHTHTDKYVTPLTKRRKK